MLITRNPFLTGLLATNRFKWAESHCDHVPALIFIIINFTYIFIYINLRILEVPTLL